MSESALDFQDLPEWLQGLGHIDNNQAQSLIKSAVQQLRLLLMEGSRTYRIP